MATQEKRVQELHLELQEWRSHIYFIEDEMHFMDKLLHSYVFEPRTPNLFERLEKFKAELDASKKDKKKLKGLITKHENTIGGIMECTSEVRDTACYKKHVELQNRLTRYFEDYRNLKSAVYAYAGSILKRRKP